MRILVIFPGALGDLICLIPALRALRRRHRDASLELMARAELARFAVGRMGVDRGHSIDRREMTALFSDDTDARADARRFFGGFDRIHSFFAARHAGFRDALASASRAELGFHRFRPDGEGHVAGAYLRALDEPVEALESRLDLLAEDRAAAARRLDGLGFTPGRFALVLPGSGSVAKNWPAPRFAELAERLQHRVPVAIVLGPAEAEIGSLFAGHAIFSDLGLGELAAIGAAASFFIGNDSGTSHLLAAAGAAGLAIFGPTDPARWRPLGRVMVLHRPSLDTLDAAEVAAATLAMP